ncbi:hypothetical protein SK128_018039 [Halocaridina rubra]|uniref:Peptidase S1 domain-containing protein n=1 Tax=Halocaridina rubra TaxID=373956 RepID=A0AAN8XD80_HALRR
MIELIIGGRVAQPGSTPWLASLKDNQYDTPVHFCGGAIISNHWVLTAARCIIGYDPPYFDVMVVLGEYDLNEEDEYWESQKLIVQVVIHPDYDYFTHNYDIALLRVFPSIDFNSRIQPLPLPPDYHDDAPIRPPGSTKELDFVAKVFDNESHLKKDTNGHGILLKNKKPDPCSSDVNDRTHHMQSNSLGYIAGWGRTEENGDLANLVHEAYVPILDNDICQAIYPGFDASVMMCAGNITHGGVDPCWPGDLVKECTHSPEDIQSPSLISHHLEDEGLPQLSLPPPQSLCRSV